MGNTLSNIIGDIKELFASKPDGSVVGIDIGTSSIKVVQLKERDGKAVLETYGAISLGPYGDKVPGETPNLSNEQVTRALNDVLQESAVSSKRGAVAIPATASLIFLINLPRRVERKNYKNAIPMEARKHIPVPISDVSLDWWEIPQRGDILSKYEDVSGTAGTEEKTVEILVAAIHNDTLQNFQAIAGGSNIQAGFSEIEVFSTIRATFNRDLSTILVMDIGASKTKLAIVDAGVVRDFHIVDRGAADLTHSLATALGVSFGRAEEIKREVGLKQTTTESDSNVQEALRSSLNFIFTESRRVALEYEKKHNETISKVVLTGGGALLPGLQEEAADHFKTDVMFGNPFEKTQAPSFLEDALKQTGPEFAVATGLALKELS